MKMKNISNETETNKGRYIWVIFLKVSCIPSPGEIGFVTVFQTKITIQIDFGDDVRDFPICV